MRSVPHILVINGTKVRRPVFVLGAPCSGADLIARAIKMSAGFHLTVGRPGVLRVAYAFARKPAIAGERGMGAARVMRDAYAQDWQVTPGSCGDCPLQCQELGVHGGAGQGPCVDARGIQRFADATPDLLYSVDVLLDAFPDAQLIQVIRDGRDVVAGMLADERYLALFRPGLANLDEVFPNPFLGVEDQTERSRWPEASAAVKCALRWRGSVRLSARLRTQVPSEQLLTLRYEELVARSRLIAAELSGYLGTRIPRLPLATVSEQSVGTWRTLLTERQQTQVDRIAGAELRKLGYER